VEGRVLLIGDGDLSVETERALEAAGAEVSRLAEPDEDDVRGALDDEEIDSVAIVARADAVVLRMALMVRVVRDDVPLLLTIFDSTMAETMERELPNTRVASLVGESLTGPGPRRSSSVRRRTSSLRRDGERER
jgi:hypothetical protein